MGRALVTGCAGFVGPYVSEALRREGWEVWGVDEKKERFSDASLERYVSLDLADRRAVEAIVREARPDAIVHLAAQSSAGRSLSEPFDTLTRNVLPALHVLEAVRSSARRTRVLAVGSGDVYGPLAESDLPASERRSPNPTNPYALSKAVQEQICLQYASLYGTDVVVTRSFNHTGAGQRDTFVLPSFARQVAEIRAGAREPVLHVGDLDLRRDFTDVRDVARAYVALLDKGKTGEVYNVCSGTSYSLRQLLALLCEKAGVAPTIRVDPLRLRRNEAQELRGDPSKIARDTGWAARIGVAETLEWLLAFWSERVEEGRRGPIG